MARALWIVWAGRHQREQWEPLLRRYRERIHRHVPVREVPVKSKVAGGDTRRLLLEGRAILAALPNPCWLVALDRGGKSFASQELADWLGERLDSWPHPIAFGIGSDLGLSEEVREAARLRLSFGPLTLPHEMARLVLYEQLYRALSISTGIKYHRQPS